jgi:hypothetical protein
MRPLFREKIRKILSNTILVPVFFSAFLVGVVIAANNVATTLNQLIDEASLSIDIVDNNGDTVPSPSVTFPTYYFSFEAGNSDAVLGTSTQKIRVSNPTTTAAWSVAIAATGGVSAVWTDGGSNTYPYNSAAGLDNGRLTVDAATNGVSTPKSGCSNTNVTKGSSATFLNGTVDSITILSASSGADTLCYWDLTAVDLRQRIPASQVTASYSLGMTLSVM